MKYLTAQDVAEEIHCSLAQAYVIIRQAGATVMGRMVRVRRDVFDQWLKHGQALHARHDRPDGECVYFIRAGQFCKIGCTSNIKRRMKELQTSSPNTLELVGWLVGDSEIERELHRRFSHLREAGEWFRLESDLCDFILENT